MSCVCVDVSWRRIETKPLPSSFVPWSLGWGLQVRLIGERREEKVSE